MRKTLIISALSLLSSVFLAAQYGGDKSNTIPASGGGVTWTLTQGSSSSTYNFTCSGTGACATGTISAVTAGNVELFLVAAYAQDSGTPILSSTVTGDTLTECSGYPVQFAYITANWEVLDCWERTSATGGATSFTWTPVWDGNAFTQFADVQIMEIHRSSGTGSVDAVGSITYGYSGSGGASCANCTAPALTVTGTDFCSIWGSINGTPTAFSSGYSNPANIDASNVFGAFAGNLSVTSFGSPYITQSPTSQATVGGICFK